MATATGGVPTARRAGWPTTTACTTWPTSPPRALNWRPLADFELAKIGLAPPHAVLTLDGQTLAFGINAVTGPQRYVRVGERVALVSARYMPRSPEIRTTELH